MSTGRAREPLTGRSVDRLINFSDAVVAVAITVLVLPLVDIPGPSQGQTVWTVIGDHAAQVWTFLFTFLVVAVMWSTHHRIMRDVTAFDGALFWLNTFWLASIVVLPWASAMYGESDSGRSSVGLFYWLVLALISALGGLMSGHLRRHAELTRDDARADQDWRARARGPAFALLFVVIGLVSLVAPGLSSWLAILAAPMATWLRPRTSVTESLGDGDTAAAEPGRQSS